MNNLISSNNNTTSDIKASGTNNSIGNKTINSGEGFLATRYANKFVKTMIAHKERLRINKIIRE
jgi:hypothetical protein